MCPARACVCKHLFFFFLLTNSFSVLLQIARERGRDGQVSEGSSASLMMRWNCLLGVVDRDQFDLYVRMLVCRVIHTSLVPYKRN